MAKQRNNVCKLPSAARFRVSQLLDDGATYDAIRADGEIAAACASRGGLALHNNSIAAYAESAEHAANLADLRTWKERVGRRQWAAKAIAGQDGATAVADTAMYAILEHLSVLAENGAETRELCQVADALTKAQRVQITRAEAERDTRLTEAERRHEAEAAALRADLAERDAEIARLQGRVDGLLATLSENGINPDESTPADEFSRAEIAKARKLYGL